MIRLPEREWGRALLLMLGPPLALFGWSMAAQWLERAPQEVPYLIGASLVMMLLGLHLMPIRWWARMAAALLFLPVVTLIWGLAVLLVGCRLFGFACS